MPNLSKIYLASGSPDKFEFLRASFGESVEFTREPSEADLIIVDLANPLNPPNWANFPPFILAAFDGPEDPSTLNAIAFFCPGGCSVKRKKEELEEWIAYTHRVLAAQQLRRQILVQHFKQEGLHD